MKNRWGWLPLAACMLAFVTAPAAGQLGNIRSFPDGYWNVGSKDKVDAVGNQYVTDADRDRDANGVYSRSGVSSTIAAAGADSSGVIDTHDAGSLVFLLKAYPSAAAGVDTSSIVRLAVSFRIHMDGLADSSNTFVWEPGADYTTLGVSATKDTVNVGHLFRGSKSSPWSGEFIITVDRNKTSRGDGVANGLLYNWPNGIAISLASIFGQQAWAPYLSYRIRNLSTVSCAVTAHLIGTPLR